MGIQVTLFCCFVVCVLRCAGNGVEEKFVINFGPKGETSDIDVYGRNSVAI
jgi:hypothetical protein